MSTNPFLMLNMLNDIIVDTHVNNLQTVDVVIQHIVATRQCIMNTGPSDYCSNQSPFEMTYDILKEGLVSVFLQIPEYKDKSSEFISDFSRPFIAALIKYYEEQSDICDSRTDMIFVLYTRLKYR